MAPSSSGLGHLILNQEIAGSNPAGVTNFKTLMFMSKYLGFIPQGFSEVTPEVLRSEIENFSTIKLEKYHIIFESNEHMDKIKRLDMFETSYVLIQYFQNNYNLESQFTWCIDHHEQLSKAIQTFSGSKKFRFRIVASRKNLSGKKFLQDVNRLQNILKKNHEILIDTGKPDYEIRLIEKENYGFIGIRIGKPHAYIDAFQKKEFEKKSHDIYCICQNRKTLTSSSIRCVAVESYRSCELI